jgi:type I restriction enzyme S subunit
MSFPRYPRYKDSGVAWLGAVPEHWEVKRLKRNMRLLSQKTNCRHNPVALENIEGWTGRFISTESEFEGEGVGFDAGDILFGKLRPYLAKVYLAESSGEAIGDFHVLRPCSGMHSRFAQYHMLSHEFIDVVDGETFGSKMPRASWESLGGMLMATPPVDEQLAIARFLDHEIAKIDALTLEQQRLIQLLKEKRQAVISHAVTKGLNPNVRMKDSGIEWLGEVPEHWGTKRVRYAVRIDNGPRFPINRTERADIRGEFPYLGPTGILDYLDHFRYEGERALIGEDGDHFNKYADWAMTQWVAGRFNVNNHAHVIASGEHCMARWFYFSFLHRDIGADLVAQGATRLKLTREALSNLLIVCPPVNEQELICAYLEAEVGRFETLTAEAQRAIDLLQERRKALIFAAVTGQIDVRSFQPAQAA